MYWSSTLYTDGRGPPRLEESVENGDMWEWIRVLIICIVTNRPPNESTESVPGKAYSRLRLELRTGVYWGLDWGEACACTAVGGLPPWQAKSVVFLNYNRLRPLGCKMQASSQWRSNCFESTRVPTPVRFALFGSFDKAVGWSRRCKTHMGHARLKNGTFDRAWAL